MRPGMWRPPFFVSSENKVYQLMLQFSKEVEASVKQLDAATNAFSEGGEKTLRIAVDGVIRAEQAADGTRRKLEFEIFSGKFFDRAEKIDLIERVDTVADFAEMAARTMLYHKAEPLTQQIRELLKTMTAHTLRAAKVLVLALDMLYTDFSRVPRTTDDIEKERDLVKEAYSKLMEKLFASKLSPKTLMLLRDITYRITRTADMAEEAGDRIRFLAVKYS